MRTCVTGLALSAAACGVLFLAPPRPADRPPPDDPDRADPPPEVRAVADRAAAKDRIAVRLITGAVRLADAVEAVLALNREWPPLDSAFYDAYPGRSLRERVARGLIGAAELDLPADDSRRAAALARLARELDALVAAEAARRVPGVAVLPAVAE